MFSKITTLRRRLIKLGISIELSGNYPWIYLTKVNGNQVNEKFYSDCAYTVALGPKSTDGDIKFIDIKGMFNIIRKYR